MSGRLPTHATRARRVPWWRQWILWVVIGAPLAVVVAGIWTTVIAIEAADTTVSVPSASTDRSAAPAMQARNHAATPAP